MAIRDGTPFGEGPRISWEVFKEAAQNLGLLVEEEEGRDPSIYRYLDKKRDVIAGSLVRYMHREEGFASLGLVSSVPGLKAYIALFQEVVKLIEDKEGA